MKLFALASAVTVCGASLVLACSGSTEISFDDPDSGSSSGTSGKLPGSSSGSSGESSSGTSGTSGTSGKDAGKDTGTSSSSSGGLTDTKLVAGDNTQIIAVTTGATPHVVYYVVNAAMGLDLEAVPVAGGAKVVLQTSIADDDYAFVNGGAVAWFTGTQAGTSGKGTATAINIWTKANGIKTVTTTTRSGLFAASEDGVNVAFGTASTDTKTDLVYTTSAAPSAATPSLTGTANAINWAAASGTAPTCTPRASFAGSVLIAAYCTGTSATAASARLSTIAAPGGAATLRVDNPSATNGIQPFFFADGAGDKIFVVGVGTANQGRIVLAGATTTVANVDPGIATFAGGTIPFADVAKDGSYATYIAGGALKKTTFAATPTISTVVATGVLNWVGASSDAKYALYNTLVDANDASTTDAKLVDVTAAAPTPVTIQATATASFYSFTAGAVVFGDTVDPQTGFAAIKAVPFTGGAAKVLAPSGFVFTFPATTGNTVLIATDLGMNDGDPWTLKSIDALAGGTLASFTASFSGNDNAQWLGKTFLYSDIGATAPGVHAAVAP